MVQKSKTLAAALPTRIEVAVGILIRASDGALLLTSRPSGKVRAGW